MVEELRTKTKMKTLTRQGIEYTDETLEEVWDKYNRLSLDNIINKISVPQKKKKRYKGFLGYVKFTVDVLRKLVNPYEKRDKITEKHNRAVIAAGVTCGDEGVQYLDRMIPRDYFHPTVTERIGDGIKEARDYFAENLQYVNTGEEKKIDINELN